MKVRGRIVAASFLGTLVLGAALLQIFYKPPPVVSGWRSDYVASNNNQLGFRGRPIAYEDDDFVIVLLGDSQVEGVGCGFERMPEARLEYYLKLQGKRVRVCSVAAKGYGQDQQLAGLQQYFERFRADLVILWLTPSNDIWNNLFPTHWPGDGYPKPTYWLEAGRLRGPVHRMDEAIEEPALAVARLLGRVRSKWLGSGRDAAWEATMPPAYTPVSPVAAQSAPVWTPDVPAGRMADENLLNEKSHLALGLTPASPRMEYGIQLTRALVAEIQSLAVANKADFRLLLVKPVESPGKTEGVLSVRGRWFRYSSQQEQVNVAGIIDGFPCLNVSVDTPKWMLAPDDPHLNERANDRAMELLASLLEGSIP